MTGRQHEPIDLWVSSPPHMLEQDELPNAMERAARVCQQMQSSGLYAQNGTDAQRFGISAWLKRIGVSLNPDSILLCLGVQHGIDLAFADLVADSPYIASESQTFHGALAVARQHGMQWCPVAHDHEGILPDALKAALSGGRCRALFTTPVCQNPLATETSIQRRLAIVELCERYDACIIEDDTYAIYSGHRHPSYKQLAPDRVYYLNGLSKCLTPLLRFGIISPPAPRFERVKARIRAQVFGAPPVTVQTACELLAMSADVTNAERLRNEARIRCDLARQILALDELPMPNGSPHIWLPMPEQRAIAFARAAQKLGVLVLPPDTTSIGDARAEGVRLALIAPPERADVERALHILAPLLAF